MQLSVVSTKETQIPFALYRLLRSLLMLDTIADFSLPSKRGRETSLRSLLMLDTIADFSGQGNLTAVLTHAQHLHAC